MITVNCSSCKAQLEMDDAFAGGVCRCHYCGTIQTVPAAAKRKSAAASAAPAKAAAGAMVGATNGRNGGGHPQVQAGRTEAAQPPSGLDALAEVVASSGLSRGGSMHGAAAWAPPGAPTQPAAPIPGVDYATPGQQKKKFTPLVLLLGIIALLLGALVVLVVGYLVVGTSRTTTVTFPPGPGTGPGTGPGPGGSGNNGGDTLVEPGPGGGGDGEEAVPVPKTPHFCGIPLDGVPSVVYVIDRGHATSDLFDTLKEATYRSIESLKPGTKFQIVFWDNGEDRVAYPADGLAEVSAKEIEAAREKLADIVAGGQAKPEGAVRKAVQSKPAAIVLVTGKAYYLEESVVKSVQDAVAGTTTKVHTVALKSDDGNTVMKDIAQKTHAEYRVLSARELRQYSY